MKPVRILAVICCLSLLLTVTGQNPEPVDTKVIDRIIAAEKTSQVMEIATVLTNTYGPRLTNSANVKGAGEYARKKLVEWQLANVRLETFNFGNGWTNERFTMKLASDPTATFQAYSKPWTVGTNGPVTAEVVAGVRSQADLTAMKGKLRGKIVLVLPAPPASAAPTTPPPIQRFTDAQLSSMGTATPATAQAEAQPAQGRGAQLPPGTPEPPAQEAGFFAWVENALSAGGWTKADPYDLSQNLGDTHTAYRARVPALIPRPSRRRIRSAWAKRRK